MSTARPPRTDAVVFVEVAADSAHEAELIACQMAACSPHVVMPVESLVTDWPENEE